MPYGEVQSNESAPSFSIGLSAQNSNVMINVSLSFQAIADVAMNTMPADVDDLFQHLVDHLATLPEFPGSGEGATIQATYWKNWQANRHIEVTPTLQ